MAVCEITIIPLGTGSPSVSSYVADCHRVLQKTEGIKYQLTAMGTIIEGDLDRLMEVVRRLHEVPFQAGAQRVTTVVRIDDRRDKEITIDGNVKAVEEKLK
ncbi:MAG: MTH1187 family thiamine-binding protein [Clostridia bacterium]|nr:MTH1187 family thiamine-binding protein [Clostridia bacterium]